MVDPGPDRQQKHQKMLPLISLAGLFFRDKDLIPLTELNSNAIQIRNVIF